MTKCFGNNAVFITFIKRTFKKENKIIGSTGSIVGAVEPKFNNTISSAHLLEVT